MFNNLFKNNEWPQLNALTSRAAFASKARFFFEGGIHRGFIYVPEERRR
jgi:hypothetical protein